MGSSVTHNKAVSNEASEGDLCVFVYEWSLFFKRASLHVCTP